MTAVRIAAATSVLGQPFRKALHIAAAAGVDGVQIDARDELRPADMTGTALRQVRKMLEEANLRVAGAALATRRGLLAPQDFERRIEAVTAAIGLASKLGGGVLVTNLGTLPAEDDARRSEVLDALTLLGAAGQRAGVVLAIAAADIEPDELATLLAELPEGTLGLDFNPGDLIAHGCTPREWLDRLGPHVVHFTAADAVPGIGGATAIQVELGRGVADVHELVARLLEQYGYRGWATAGRRGSASPEQELHDAAAFIRSCGH